MATAPQFYDSKKDMAKDLCQVLNDKSLAFGTKRAVLEHVQAAWPEWDGKFDRFPGDAHARGVDSRRINQSKHYSYERVPEGCRYWSAGALEQWLQGNRKQGEYRFEHVVPRGVVREFLLGPMGGDASARWRVPLRSGKATFNFLDQFCIGAVITREEDARLATCTFPGDLAAPKVDPWARYKVLNLTDPGFVVYDLSTGKRAFKVARR